MQVSAWHKDLAVAAGVLGVGFFFLVLSVRIPEIAGGGVGPGYLPTMLSILMIVLGALQIAGALLSRQAKSSQPFSARSFLAVGGVSVLVVIYIVLFGAFGYFLSTLVVLGAAQIWFGVRKPHHIVLTTLGGTLVYYLFFIRVMGIYEPTGRVFDFSSYLPF